MATMKDRSVTAREAALLKSTRQQLGRVRSARRRCNEIVSAHGMVKSVRLDGMPAGNRLPCGFDGDAGQAEKLLQILQREETELKKRRAACRRIIERLPEALHLFCLYYYLDGLTVKETAWMMDKTERSCWGYKKIIEQQTPEGAADGQEQPPAGRMATHPPTQPLEG